MDYKRLCAAGRAAGEAAHCMSLHSQLPNFTFVAFP